MRAIHQVSQHETLLASGVYTSYTDSTPMGSLESWSIHTLPDSSRLVRADVDNRAVNGTSLLVHALFAPADSGVLVDRVDFQWQTPQLRAQAIYTAFDHELHVGRTIGRGERDQVSHAFPDGYQIDPVALSARLFIAYLADHQLEHSITAPQLTSDESRLLLPTDSVSRAVWEADETLTVAGQQHAARRCRLTDQQGGTQTAWFNAQGIPLQLDEPVTQRRTVLTQLLYRSVK